MSPSVLLFRPFADRLFSLGLPCRNEAINRPNVSPSPLSPAPRWRRVNTTVCQRKEEQGLTSALLGTCQAQFQERKTSRRKQRGLEVDRQVPRSRRVGDGPVRGHRRLERVVRADAVMEETGVRGPLSMNQGGRMDGHYHHVHLGSSRRGGLLAGVNGLVLQSILHCV